MAFGRGYARRPKKLPIVLSREEMARLIGAVRNDKYRTVLMTMYGAGLRVSEAVRLRPGDIDSQRMAVRVEQGKGAKDRYVMLSPRLLEQLRQYWRLSYNSCRNRHCPKCQSLAKAAWLQARRAELLPVAYYHVVFTLPDQLGPLALQNKRAIYNILFQAASRSLLEIGADPRHLGAELGLVAVLHTWGQTLMHHPHLHCIVPGGGLSPDATRWIGCREGFFLPVRVLAALQEECRKLEWVVYVKPPFGGPEKVLDYLGRYTHRIAISNHRLLELKDGQVSFTWKNYKQGGRRQVMRLEAAEFMRRFLMHTLPDGFVRIRFYGLLANAHRAVKLQHCRELLGVAEEAEKPATAAEEVEPEWAERLRALTGRDPLACPKCEAGRLACIRTLSPPARAAPEAAEVNSS